MKENKDRAKGLINVAPKSLIANFPHPLGLLLSEYNKETHPYVKLHRIIVSKSRRIFNSYKVTIEGILN